METVKAEHSSLVGVLFGAVLIWFKYVSMGAFFPLLFLYGRCGHAANSGTMRMLVQKKGGVGLAADLDTILRTAPIVSH